MKTSLLIFLGFAVLAVILAAEPKKKARNVDTSQAEGAKEEKEPSGEKKSDNGNATSSKDEDDVETESSKSSKSSKSKQKSKSSPAKQPKKPAEQEEKQEQEESEEEVETKTTKSKTKSKSPASKKSKKAVKEEQEEEQEESEEEVETKTTKSKSPATKKSKKAADEEQEEEQEDSEDEEDLEDLLNDDEEDEEEDDDEVTIPAAKDLTSNSNPIELAEKIRNLDDKDKRKELIGELRQLRKENRNIFPGIFYRAVLAALKNEEGAEEAAQQFWDKQIKKATNKLVNARRKSVGGIGSGIDNARKLVRADPVGVALRRGEAVFLTVLSDALKNVGKLGDFAYDTVGNVSKFMRAATFPVDGIPFASDIKNNVHDLIEEQVERGKFLNGSFSENGSEAFARAAKKASKIADEKEDLLRRQFYSKRTLL